MIEVYKIISGYAQPIIDNFFSYLEKKTQSKKFLDNVKKKSKKHEDVAWREYPIEHFSSAQISQKNATRKFFERI